MRHAARQVCLPSTLGVEGRVSRQSKDFARSLTVGRSDDGWVCLDETMGDEEMRDVLYRVGSESKEETVERKSRS